MEMVQRINRELGTTILLAEHRLAEAVPRSDRLLVLEGGQLLCQGTPREVGAWLRRQNHPLAAALPAPMEIWDRGLSVRALPGDGGGGTDLAGRVCPVTPSG